MYDLSLNHHPAEFQLIRSRKGIEGITIVKNRGLLFYVSTLEEQQQLNGLKSNICGHNITMYAPQKQLNFFRSINTKLEQRETPYWVKLCEIPSNTSNESIMK